LHTIRIIIDDDSLFALHLSINIPYREFWSSLKWIVLSSAAIVLLLAAILIYILKTMFRQKTLEQMRRDFTHNITHELKTPIAVASAATDALVNFSAEADPHRRRRYLQIIGKQLGELSSMVERILSVSVEGKEEKMEMEGISLFPIIHSTVEEISMGLENPPEIEVTCGKDIEIYGDRFHLKNVMATLIDNAVKYGCGEDAAKGECGEGCGRNRIAVTAEKNDGYARICIEDNGPGIAKEHLQHIFEKYYRVPQGDLQKARGYGLGLYYAQKVVQRHGGTIEVKSRPGKGTKFTITLPIRENGAQN
jgi:signal transduction histidine kinase